MQRRDSRNRPVAVSSLLKSLERPQQLTPLEQTRDVRVNTASAAIAAAANSASSAPPGLPSPRHKRLSSLNRASASASIPAGAVIANNSGAASLLATELPPKPSLAPMQLAAAAAPEATAPSVPADSNQLRARPPSARTSRAETATSQAARKSAPVPVAPADAAADQESELRAKLSKLKALSKTDQLHLANLQQRVDDQAK